MHLFLFSLFFFPPQRTFVRMVTSSSDYFSRKTLGTIYILIFTSVGRISVSCPLRERPAPILISSRRDVLRYANKLRRRYGSINNSHELEIAA